MKLLRATLDLWDVIEFRDQALSRKDYLITFTQDRQSSNHSIYLITRKSKSDPLNKQFCAKKVNDEKEFDTDSQLFFKSPFGITSVYVKKELNLSNNRFLFASSSISRKNASEIEYSFFLTIFIIATNIAKRM